MPLDSPGDPPAAAPELPQCGVILDGGAEGPLAEAPVSSFVTRAGDRIWAVTHAGHGYKPTNEDRIALVEVAEPPGHLSSFFVVDGMGGHRGGDLSAQTLSEELVSAYSLEPELLAIRRRELLLANVLAAVDQLGEEHLIASVAAEVNARVLARAAELEPPELLAAAVEAAQAASVRATRPEQDRLRRIAELIHTLSRVAIPDRAEIALVRTRGRLSPLGPDHRAPDACFVGAVVRTDASGERTLDVRQVGDCRLVVVSADGTLRLASINDSMVPEPDLHDPALSLSTLMAYSLHRNVVASSLMSCTTLKRYRRDELPLLLAPGDTVYLYSDGVDDLFAPEELVELGRHLEPGGFARQLLAWSERRMRHVDALLHAERSSRSPQQTGSAYPAVHQTINEARIRDGRYLERYQDGSFGRWLKPPKCDNLALCVVRVGGR